MTLPRRLIDWRAACRDPLDAPAGLHGTDWPAASRHLVSKLSTSVWDLLVSRASVARQMSGRGYCAVNIFGPT